MHRDTGALPVPAEDPAATMFGPISITLPTDADWQELGAEPMTARVGKDFGYTP